MSWRDLALDMVQPAPMWPVEFVAQMHRCISHFSGSLHDESGIHKKPIRSTRLPAFTNTQEAVADMAILVTEFCLLRAVTPEDIRDMVPPPNYVGRFDRLPVTLLCSNLHLDTTRVGELLQMHDPVEEALGTLIHRIEQTATRVDGVPHPDHEPTPIWWLWHCTVAKLEYRRSR